MTVLIVTNEADSSVDPVIETLNNLDRKVFRLNTEKLATDFELVVSLNEGLFGGALTSALRTVSFDEIRSIWYRRPMPVSFRPEALSGSGAVEFVRSETSLCLQALWRAMEGVYWISPPRAIRAAESKIEQLCRAHRLGLRTPRTLITNNPKEVLDFCSACRENVIYKPFGAAFLPDSRQIYTTQVSENDLRDVTSVRPVPCIFQEKIDKSFELRITMVGHEIFSAKIASQESERTRVDWRRYDLENTPHSVFPLPDSIAERCRLMVSQYELEFAAIDMAVTSEGEYVFFELNPNGQWLWIEQLTGLPISQAIAGRLASA